MIRRLSFCVICVINVALWSPCEAQTSTQILQQMDSIANPPLSRHEALQFETTQIDLGQMSEETSPQTVHFTFTNAGDKPFVITKAAASCGCVSATFPAQPVLPGARGEVSATYRPKGHPGQVIQHLFVYTNHSSMHPAVRLTLVGRVEANDNPWQSYRVALGSALRARSRKMTFANLTRGEQRTERIECVNTGKVPLRLRAVAELLPPHLTFGCEPAVLAPGQRGDLVVTLDGRAVPERLATRTEWEVIVAGAPGKPSEMSLRIVMNFVN